MVNFTQKDEDAIQAWVSYLDAKTEAEVRTLQYRIGSDDEVGVFRVNKHLVEVQVSRYEKREPPTVITHEQKYANELPAEIVSVVLDVYGGGGYDPDRDHFLLFPGLKPSETVKLRVLGPGEYSDVDESNVNNWDMITKEVNDERDR